LARPLLSLGTRIGALAFALVACRAPARHDGAGAAASGSAASAADDGRAAHFDSETKRARELWLGRPQLTHCAEVLSTDADRKWCDGASAGLAEIEALSPSAPAELVLATLGRGALALAHVLDRARYLAFTDLSERGLHGPAAPASGSASGPAHPAPAASSSLGKAPAMKLSESPAFRLIDEAAAVERGTLRELTAYLEYAPLPVRKQAFVTCSGLLETHPRWAELHGSLREAAVLESDPELKAKLTALAARGLPPGPKPDQPTGSK